MFVSCFESCAIEQTIKNKFANLTAGYLTSQRLFSKRLSGQNLSIETVALFKLYHMIKIHFAKHVMSKL